MRLRNQQGYTLVETIVYVFILVVIISAVMSLIVVMVRTLGDVRINENLTTGGLVSLDRVVREVQLSESINSAGSTFDSDAGVLLLDSINNEGEATTYRFYVSENSLFLSIDGGEGIDLMPDHIVVESFVLRRFFGAVAEGVKIELSLSDTRDSDKMRSFYTSATVR